MSVSKVAFTCDEAGNSNVRVWDLNTGGQLAAYPGGVSEQRTLSFIRGDYILSGQQDKAVFNLWSFRQFNQINKKFAAPGKIRAMDVSSCGLFCVAGIDSELFVWEVQSGCLLNIIRSHYQPVTVVKFMPHECSFVTSSMDTEICVWSLGLLTSDLSEERTQPDLTFRNHTQAVTDIAIRGSLIASSSTSGLLAIHSTRTRCLEYEHNFGEAILSVAIASPCDAVFAGLRSGKIIRLDLSNESRIVFEGHGGAVECISVSDSFLLSGSKDCTARIWDANRGHLLQTLRHDGPVSNARIDILPYNALVKETDSSKALSAIQNFQRTVQEPSTIRGAGNAFYDTDSPVVNIDCRAEQRTESIEDGKVREKRSKDLKINHDLVSLMLSRDSS